VAVAALARAELVRQVKQAYWDVALADQIVALDRGSVEFAQTLLEAANTQYELGNQPYVQVLKAELEVARARQELYRSQAVAEQTRARLNTLLGREPKAGLALGDAPTPVTGDWALARLTELALRQRPDLRQAQAAVETAHGEVAVARAARRSDVTFVGHLSPEGLGGFGLSLNFPQLGWGGLKADVQRAEAMVGVREQQLELVRGNCRLETANALTGVVSAQARAAEYRECVLEQSGKLAELAMLGYREGASAFLDVLEARRTLRAVNVEYYLAVADQQKSLAKLECVLGGCLPDPTKPGEVK
jgi:cobalt-zinc-cadmium efflux system outer membrane protein